MARAKRRSNYVPGQNTITISIDTSSVDDLLDSLGAEVAAAIRPAAQAGAQVIYDQARANVSQLRQRTGKLLASIYQVYSKDKSVDGQIATYHVSWNAKKAPHGQLVEYGHIQKYRVYLARKGPNKGQFVTDKTHPITPKQIAATAFMRRAIAAKSAAAVEAMAGELIKRLSRNA